MLCVFLLIEKYERNRQWDCGDVSPSSDTFRLFKNTTNKSVEKIRQITLDDYWNCPGFKRICAVTFCLSWNKIAGKTTIILLMLILELSVSKNVQVCLEVNGVIYNQALLCGAYMFGMNESVNVSTGQQSHLADLHTLFSCVFIKK